MAISRYRRWLGSTSETTTLRTTKISTMKANTAAATAPTHRPTRPPRIKPTRTRRSSNLTTAVVDQHQQHRPHPGAKRAVRRRAQPLLRPAQARVDTSEPCIQPRLQPGPYRCALLSYRSHRSAASTMSSELLSKAMAARILTGSGPITTIGPIPCVHLCDERALRDRRAYVLSRVSRDW